MPELIDQMYCSQQIVIPPKFPYVLKRYAKAAIKTQPYDLLRWSFEYFKALSENRIPPVKLRLEYPIYSTEGGLTRGYLKVLALQLEGTDPVPLSLLKSLWSGSCLDSCELRRALCLCEVHQREDIVPRLRFLAVAAGFLTKSLTHTMILLCETLTKEPDGGSAAVPLDDFLMMYRFLAAVDASKDVKYFNGYREGETPKPESIAEEDVEEEEPRPSVHSNGFSEGSSDEYVSDGSGTQRLSLINARVPRSTRLSIRLSKPLLIQLDRSPSVERAKQIERDNYQRERKGRAAPSKTVEDKLREMSGGRVVSKEKVTEVKNEEETKKELEIFVYDEKDNPLPLEFYGEPVYCEELEKETEEMLEEQEKENVEEQKSEKERIAQFVAECYQSRKERLEDLILTFEEIAALVDRYKSAYYDLSMVAGRQMSTTSGEFIVNQIEKDIMEYINEQIAVLPDPDLKKKKAKPEEVAMIKEMLSDFLEENMELIVPEVEEVEEEEAPVPEVTVVYAVPGIGPAVEEEIVKEFIEYAIDVSKSQADLFMPRNIRHFLCPPLEKLPECNFEVNLKKEEVPTGGIITE